MSGALAQSWSWPTDPSVYAFAVAILATGYVYLKARRKSRRDPLAGPPPFSSLAAQRRVESQMTQLLVELEKMARQMNAQLDTRAAKLEELIRQADERLAALEQAERSLAERRSTPVLRLRPADGADVSLGPPGEGESGVAEEEAFPSPIPIDPRHAQVCRLADEGRDVHEIARELRLPAGEVQLILKLCQRAKSAGGRL
ncbi:MAG: hypothetical protein ACK4PI_12995 [Tepidisphaerales bacterium]